MVFKKQKIAYATLIILGVIMLIAVIIAYPINQDLAYHDFSDDNIFLKVNNFWNVTSNLPFLIVGFLGVYNIKSIAQKKFQYLVFFSGVFLIGIGSSYYHYNPNNFTLIFDRLPMTVVFMSLISIVISEFVNCKIGSKLLIPILLFGLVSVLYWIFFNDLSLYVFIQFYPMLAIPIILICFKSKHTNTYGYWLLLIFYIIAKLCEYYDDEIFGVLKAISGHSLKHIISAVGLFVLFRTFIKRRKIEIKN